MSEVQQLTADFIGYGWVPNWAGKHQRTPGEPGLNDLN